ncbi:MAG TPA: cytochrome c3 family protein [Candidatus Krumholzibacteria bacterium]|nr:cytochrome c3 family protein [Candidatus Krumholzibacteria bacterium]
MRERRDLRIAGPALAVWVMCGVSTATAQVSPGPLARAHASLEGNLKCQQCHGASKAEMDRKCLACHGEIAWEVSNTRGFHGREGKSKCAACHPDHGGADFKLVAWPDKAPEKFDHGRTGFALQGRHAGVACEKCHVASHAEPAVAGQLKHKGGEMAWAGMDRNCSTCHEDFHKGALGANCAGCHTEQGWKMVTNFDHSRTTFPLTGLHAKVPCAKCHEAPQLDLARDAQGRVQPLYKPLPHAECVACHADVHKGAFGTACSRCHATTGFKVVNAATFDHDRTRYPLRGGHAGLACARCHDEKTAWGKKPPFATCAGCHKDPHAGQATLRGEVTDCASCHTVNGYRPSIFTVEQHARTKYALQGAHAAVACGDCHGRTPPGSAGQVAALMGTAKVWFHPAHDRCVECHFDPHGGRFSPGGERARKDDCLACHTMQSFKPSTMDDAAHDGARFKLAGAHRATPCFACHQELAAAPGANGSALKKTRPLPFTIAGQNCRDCHQSPHGNQFDARKDGGACDVCHDVEHFKPASRFDHSKMAGFKLDGAHARVACGRCHPVATTNGKRIVVYRPVPSKCVDCHASDGVLKG